MGTLSRSNWNLEVLVFEERGKPEHLEKKDLSLHLGNPDSPTANSCQCSATLRLPVICETYESFKTDVIWNLEWMRFRHCSVKNFIQHTCSKVSLLLGKSYFLPKHFIF